MELGSVANWQFGFFGKTYLFREKRTVMMLGGCNLKTKHAALYVRVSSGEQNTGAQERALRDYVQRRGWKLQQIYRDHGVSGASSKRPALN